MSNDREYRFAMVVRALSIELEASPCRRPMANESLLFFRKKLRVESLLRNR